MTPISTLINRLIATRTRPTLALLAIVITLFAVASRADTPPGWINSENKSAYTTNNGELEITIAGLVVNSGIDLLNVREDLFAGNQRLAGDSVDLAGTRLEVHYGITEWLAVFYQDQSQLMKIDLGEIGAVNVLNIDSSIGTKSRRMGFKWIFYARDLPGLRNPETAAALEIATFRSQSDDFEVIADAINLPDATVAFDDPRTIAVNDLQDSGWEARVLYSTTLSSGLVASAWAGYRDAEASSATGSNIPTELLPESFNQAYRLDDSYWVLGASLNFNLGPRLPVVLGYEYFKRNDLSFSLDPPGLPEQVPGFLSADAMPDDSNLTLSGRVSWWLTPRLQVSMSTKYFSNQFLGLIPHFNNPLSGSFSAEPYGYFGFGLGYSLRGL